MFLDICREGGVYLGPEEPPMRAFTRLVFDDQVAGTTAVFTPDAYSDLIGSASRLAIQAVAGNISGSSVTLTVRVQSSLDGRNWSYKSATPEIDTRGITAGTTATEAGTDSGQTPSLGKVRLSIALGGTTPSAQLRVWVTGRNAGSSVGSPIRRRLSLEPDLPAPRVRGDEGRGGDDRYTDRAPSVRVRRSSTSATLARGR